MDNRVRDLLAPVRLEMHEQLNPTRVVRPVVRPAQRDVPGTPRIYRRAPQPATPDAKLLGRTLLAVAEDKSNRGRGVMRRCTQASGLGQASALRPRSEARLPSPVAQGIALVVVAFRHVTRAAIGVRLPIPSQMDHPRLGIKSARTGVQRP
jgi:hypothetical protein